MAELEPSHQIRLAGPWQSISLEGQAQRVKLPCDLVGGTLVRTFNGSEGLLQARLVLLRLAVDGETPTVSVNGQQIPAQPTESLPERYFDVTSNLTRSNRLEVARGPNDHCRLESAALLIFEK